MGYTTPRVNPNVTYEQWVIMMCHCRFINCNKNFTLVWDADNGRGNPCLGMMGYVGNLYLPHNFAVNIKLLLKNSVYLKKKKKGLCKLGISFINWGSTREIIPRSLSSILFLFMYLSLAALGPCCYARAFSSCSKRELLFIAVRGLVIVMASLVVEHRL